MVRVVRLLDAHVHGGAPTLGETLEEGAEVFICGDKGKMAADVQKELLAIIETEGGRSPEQAVEYVNALKKSHRLKLDVY